MHRAHHIVAERRRLASIYEAAFAELDWLQTPISPDRYGHGYQSYPCLFEPQHVYKSIETYDQDRLNHIHHQRNAWMEDLQKQGISTRPATHAVHMLSYYSAKYA